MAASKTDNTGGTELSELPPALLKRFADMAVLIPEGGGDGAARLLEAILNVGNPDDLDAAWRTKDTERLAGEHLMIESAERSSSDFSDGLGVFLIVHAVKVDTGEEIVFTTGSISIVAQIARAYALDALPLSCMIKRAEQPSKNGYYPQHLEMVKMPAGSRR